MEWKISKTPVNYLQAVEFMEERVGGIISGANQEMVWLLEHPAIYTAGTSAKAEDLLDGKRFPVYQTGRGGEYAYHGPGQQIAYVMLDLKKRTEKPDLRRYVNDLEQWIINTLQYFDIKGERRDGRVGIWVKGQDGSEAKIAALGVRVRKWVTYHGISINLNPDLSHFSGIVPCGLNQYGVTSIARLNKNVGKEELVKRMQESFLEIYKTT